MSPHVSSTSAPHTSARLRRGFTVIELLVVIVIIGILAALILPALGSASRTARITQVQVDIKGLETAIVAFKSEYGVTPPSGITLYEEGGMWSVASQTIIRRMWPQFNFAIDRDINGDGDTTDVITLNGSECLVFFLGGMTATDVVAVDGSLIGTIGTTPTEWTPRGFSKNARNPFARDTGTRVGPFQEFDKDRFVNTMFVSTDHGMPELLDTLPSQTNPIAYASSYDGRGYVVADLMGTGMTSVYLQEDADTSTVGDITEIPWNQTTFQIISPGYDTDYGLGGLYEPEGNFPSTRSDERDNITNFGSGQLE